jgi:hypothetical protein
MKYIALISSLIISFSSNAQSIKIDFFTCKDSYTKIERLITNFSELRDSMSPINQHKKLYLDGLRWKVLNGSESERQALSQTYYSDPDYPIYSLMTSLNFVINDAINFRGKKRWEDDRDLLNKAANGTLRVTLNGSGNDPYQNMIKLVELSRGVSLFLNEYSVTISDLKERGQLYKIGKNKTFSWDISSYHFTYTSIAQCHLAYLQQEVVDREINSLSNKN